MHPPNQFPLAGRRIVLTRAQGQTNELAEALRTLGAEPLVCSAIKIEPPADWIALDQALRELAQTRRYRWVIFTSVNAVQAVLGRLAQLNLTATDLGGWSVAAIGKATARVLRAAGIEPNFVPSSSVAEAIVAELDPVADQHILLPQADIARPTLRDGLAARGAIVNAVVAYRTTPDPQATELATLLHADGVAAVTFTSSSTVRYTLEALQSTGLDPADATKLLNQCVLASIGPITSATARQLGLHISLEANPHDHGGLVAALVAYFQPTNPPT